MRAGIPVVANPVQLYRDERSRRPEVILARDVMESGVLTTKPVHTQRRCSECDLPLSNGIGTGRSKRCGDCARNIAKARAREAQRRHVQRRLAENRCRVSNCPRPRFGKHTRCLECHRAHLNASVERQRNHWRTKHLPKWDAIKTQEREMRAKQLSSRKRTSLAIVPLTTHSGDAA